MRLDRFEKKFVLSGAQKDALMERIGPRLCPDENGGSGAMYPVVSLYYDTAERDCHWERERGVPSRRKLRVRVYGSGDGAIPASAFIEVKHKCDGRGVKRRVALPLAEALRCGDGLSPEGVDLSPAERRIVTEVRDLVQQRGFRPVMVMRYDRLAFAASEPGSDLRVTFDTGIRSRVVDLVPEPDDRRFGASALLHPEGTAVLEVKVTGSVPYWMSRALGECGCRIQSHSKYSAALERMDPVLHAMLGAAGRASLRAA